MSAYVIFIRNETRDPDKLAEYRKLTPAIAAKHPITRRARTDVVEAAEGDPAEGINILEFPDLAAARAFYHGAEYQAASKLRRQGADYRVLIVEGLD
jgi:uncharacterized protein (DUF1330 family)